MVVEDDFTMYQGADATPYYVVLDEHGCPVDVSAITEATWIAATLVGQDITEVIVKHLDDIDTPIVVAEDPEESISTDLKTAADPDTYSITVNSSNGFGVDNTFTIDDGVHNETKIISSVDGNVISFTVALVYGYAIGTDIVNITQNCIFVHISPDDTGSMAEVGSFMHELRITLNALQYVVYPEVGQTASFGIVQSLTWNADTGIPRLPLGGTIQTFRMGIGAEAVAEDPISKKKAERQRRDEERRKKAEIEK